MSGQTPFRNWSQPTISKKFALFFAVLLLIAIASGLVVDRSHSLRGAATQVNLSGSLRYLALNTHVNTQHYGAQGVRADLVEIANNLARFRRHLDLLRSGGVYLGREVTSIPLALQADLTLVETAFIAYEKELAGFMAAADRRLFNEERGEVLLARANETLQAADRLTHALDRQVEAAQAEVRTTMIVVILIDVAILLAGLFAIRLQLVSPLRRLAVASRRIAHGHYDERLEISSGDEIGQLAGSFNDMADRIQRDMAEIAEDNRSLVQAREELRKFALAVEHSPAAVLISDAQGVIQYVNPRFCEVSGYSAEETIGNKPGMMKSGQTPLSVYREMWQTISSGREWRGELLNRKKNGELFWESVWVMPVQGEDGSIIHYVAIKEDVTEKIQAELERVRMNELLEQRVAERTARLTAINKEMEAFSYSVSHDLRAPLRGINGFAHLMVESCGDCSNQAALDCLGRIQRASRRMGEIIDDLLDLSRIARREVHIEPVDLSKTARAILAEHLAGDPDRHVTVTVEDDIVVSGDSRLLHIMLANLLGNAWKYTSKCAVATITLGSRLENGERVVSISDNGAGFDMKYSSKLFGAFQRLHGPHEFEGTGIGLATVERIIHRHGGRIWAEGKVGQGATFHFTLSDRGSASQVTRIQTRG